MTGEEIWKLRKASWQRLQSRPTHDVATIDKIVDELRQSWKLNNRGGVEPPVPINTNRWK